MADRAITDYTEKTDVHGDELIELVDLRETAAADQNKKMKIQTIFNAVVTYNGSVVVYNGNIVYVL